MSQDPTSENDVKEPETETRPEADVTEEAIPEPGGDGPADSETEGAIPEPTDDELAEVEDEPPDTSPEDLAGDAMAAQAEDAEAAPELPAEIPKYKYKRQVQAFEILEILNMGNGRVRIKGPDGVYMLCDAAYVDRCRPQVGGFFVTEHDGNQTYLTAAAFEEAYSKDGE